MKRLFLLFLLIPVISFSQENLEQELDSISTVEDAKAFAKTHKKINSSKVLTFNKEKHKTRLATDLFKLSKGGKKVVKSDDKRTFYKVIDKEKVLHHRVSYIMLDGKKLGENDINSKRKKIISQFNQGYNFDKLAKLHSMDPNANRGGDLGWFPKGRMHSDFENAIINNNHGEIFTLDIPERQWYFVILKTHESQNIEEIKVLKYTEITK